MWHCYDRYLSRFGELELSSTAESIDAEQFKKTYFSNGDFNDENAHLTVFVTLFLFNRIHPLIFIILYV